MIFIRKIQVRVPENIKTMPRWTGIITAWLLDQDGSLYTREQPFLSVNNRCLARCHRSEGQWKRGENENRWDSPVALLQLAAFSERLETERPLHQAGTALLCLLGNWYSSNCQKAQQASRWEAASGDCAFPKQRKELLQSRITDC